MNDDLTVKQRDTLKQLRDDGWVAYYRGTRLMTTRRQQAVRGPGRSAEPTGRRDHEDPMSTIQPSQEDRRDDWEREDWPGLSPSRQQQTSIADDSEAGRGPSGDAETGAARSTPVHQAVAVVHRAVSGTTPELMSSTRRWLNPRQSRLVDTAQEPGCRHTAVATTGR